MTVLVIEGRDFAVDRLAGSAFSFIPTFLDADGEAYVPTTVHTKVVLKDDGTQIIALTEVVDWDQGVVIPVPGSWTELQDETELREEHVIRVIGDNGNPSLRNELRMIIGCLNPER